MDANLRSKAIHFLRLHRGPHILMLANAWDAASARIYERAGFAAIGTTSAGVAASLGFPDGQHISRAEMLAAVRRIAAAVSIPVSADVEAGYGPRPEDAAETARGVIEAGAVGLNLEDAASDGALFEVARQVERIQAVREAARAAGIPLVINARTDVYLAEMGDPAGRFAHALNRLKAYRDAGADCLFLPGVREGNTIARMARELAAPLNILAGPGTPSARDLENVGVARLSVGSGPMRACMGLLRRIAKELLEQGTYELLTEGAVTYGEMNLVMGTGG